MLDIYINSNENPEFSSFYLSGEQIPIEILPNFNNINLLIGANNSGKSRFMREMMKQQKLYGSAASKELLQQLTRYIELLTVTNIMWKKNPGLFSTSSGNPLYDRYHAFMIQPFEVSPAGFFKPFDINLLSNYLPMLMDIQQIGRAYLYQYFVMYEGGSPIAFRPSFEDDLLEMIKLNKEITEKYEIIALGTQLNYFIPTLRSAHSLFKDQISGAPSDSLVSQPQFKKLSPYVFFDTLVKNYKLNKLVTREPVNYNENKKRVYIFTGLDLYHQIVNARNGTREQRKNFDNFEKFLSKSFFNEKSIDIVALFNIDEKNRDVDENELINITIGSETQSLHDLGDGIQSLIILMYSIFLAPKGTVIFIDEPELNLHPGMQRLFLEQITGNPDLVDKQLIYVIATHSNHLLDLTLEKEKVSIYSFSRTGDNNSTIKNVNIGDNELLRQLGVNNSSVFLANASIWVEGISDRNYIKAFLKAYCSEKGIKLPKEDIDFAFLEYAGSNLVHYDFADIADQSKMKAFALNNRICIIADQDEYKKEKHNAFEELAALQPNNLMYKTTGPCREIENMLSVAVWKKLLIDFCNKKEVAKNKKGILEEIEKKTGAITAENYASKYIGEYLQALGLNHLNDIYEMRNTSPGTLKSGIKISLSEAVLKGVNDGSITWQMLSSNSQVEPLVKSIYNFITLSPIN